VPQMNQIDAASVKQGTVWLASVQTVCSIRLVKPQPEIPASETERAAPLAGVPASTFCCSPHPDKYSITAIWAAFRICRARTSPT
jgi:hypothetical protein